MKFSIYHFFSKCQQILSFLRKWRNPKWKTSFFCSECASCYLSANSIYIFRLYIHFTPFLLVIIFIIFPFISVNVICRSFDVAYFRPKYVSFDKAISNYPTQGFIQKIIQKINFNYMTIKVSLFYQTVVVK